MKDMIVQSVFKGLQKILLVTVLKSRFARTKVVKKIVKGMELAYKWVALLNVIVMQDLQMTDWQNVEDVLIQSFSTHSNVV